MKQNMKKLWVVLCMVICLAALSGCSKAETAEEIDPQVVSAMEQYANYYLNLFAGMTREEVETEIIACEKNKNTTMLSAFQSWESVMDEMGEYIASNPVVVELTDDGYIARVNSVFTERDMDFSIMINEEGTEILGISFAPEYTMGEKMTKAALNTVMGMGVVFVVLIFIAWLISLFKYISVFENKMKAKAAAKEAPAAAPAAPAPTPAAVPVVEDVSDDTELIAVIAAAIAASEGKTSTDGLVVRSIKRVSNRSWR